MRWVTTWKPSDEHTQGRKAKSSIVILESQHPEVKVSSPTLFETWKDVLTLQWTAFNNGELDCADAKSAVLQGDGHELQHRFRP